MRQLGLHEVRREFLDFFQEKSHLIASSFSLIPKNDKSLLLIGAGMAPLKKYFTGEATPPRNRMATCQKCIRTGDIENVGKTDRHATFFEMLGNFSFGNYFKKEAIEWAWEFLHERMEIPKEQLWVSVYEEDDEAYELWMNHIGVPKERIVRLGKEDNFWELEVGPSGPCSEIYVDRGEKYGCGSDSCRPGCECDRFIEVWNLVFTQFDKDERGVYHPLAHPNIDTGMGLERITAVLEGADNIFEVKAIRDIIRKIEEMSNYKYGNDKKKDESIRVITDHSRAMTFLVSDGVLPSNEGRGYVLRRLIRRAARHGKLLGIENEFLTKIVDVVIDSWKVEYEDLSKRENEIKKIIRIEEEKFQETIDQGIEILVSYIDEMKNAKEDTLDGERAFKLYDTYGFPLDLTREILEEKSLLIDEEGFHLKMEEQRNRARKAREEKDSGWGHTENVDLFKGLESTFRGYETIELSTNIIGLYRDDEEIQVLNEKEDGIIVLAETPFYGESGGQIGDAGIIENPNFKAEVVDTRHTKNGLTIHMVRVINGSAKKGDKVDAIVEGEKRRALMRNHSATHLLHKALKEILGDHVEQAGSLVLPNRLRFDFTHYDGLSQHELLDIEYRVNSMILKALDVTTTETNLEDAQNMGAVGLFEDKYGDVVRVVDMGGYSRELCGGTHVSNTAEIGMFKLISESGIAAGVRRIEAITGMEVYRYINNLEEEIHEVSSILKTNRTNLVEKSKSIVEEIKERDKDIEELRKKLSKDVAEDILKTAIDIDGVSTIVYRVEGMDMNNLRDLGDNLKSKIGSGVILLASIYNNKLTFLSMVTKDLNAKGIMAGNIVKGVSKITGGNGGGRPDMAQAGGKDISKLDDALSIVPDLIREQIK
ncbi:alanine--tRNA ligase [Tissierellaceae bacterium HCP3S3_D8]